MNLIPLILSGGAGARLWPASREARPKQFLSLFGGSSTFQETLKRVGNPELFGRPVVITNREHRFLVSEQLRSLGVDADIVLEPVRRDSGPAIAAGCHYVKSRDGADAIVIALAADHLVRDASAFEAACRDALSAASKQGIVVFGIKPDRPATGYGYVKPGVKPNGTSARKVSAFVEKPDAATAKTYLDEGYLWNSGNFVFRCEVLLGEYARFEPESEMAAGEAVSLAKTDLDFIVLDEKSFMRATPRSIDYAVMEKTDKAAVVPADIGWSDVGSWEEVWSAADKDAAGNVMRGPAKALNATDNLIVSDKVMTAVVGVEGLAVIATEDAILVTRKSESAALKSMVAELRQSRPNITENSARVYRPWGTYQSLDMGERYQVKRIVVTPGGRLSLQKHFHRSEHWIVVKGTAQVTIGEMVKTVHENESIYVPIGSLHRLENPGKIDLELIEVQTGSYLGEDDIVRVEDVYNRADQMTG